MSKARPPRTELDWTLADAPDVAALQTAPLREVPPARPKRRPITWRGVALAALLVGVAALGAWLTVQVGWQRLRAQVAQEAAYEDAQALAYAVENVLAVQADDAAWRQVRAAEAAVGLPSALPAAHLLPSGDAPTLTDFRLIADNVFEAKLQRTYHDSAGQAFTFDYVQRYRNLGPGLWERLRPDNAALTEQVEWRGSRVIATFPVSDTAIIQPLLTQLDLALGQTCAAWACPPERVITIFVNPFQLNEWLRPSRPDWEPEAGRAPYPAAFDLYPNAPVQGDPLLITLPSPHWAGLPHDAAAQQAMLRALTVRALLALAAPAAAPDHRIDDYAAALVARAEVRLGLAAPLAYTPLPETYRSPQSLWTLRPPDAATRRADQQQALALLDFALAGQPPEMEGQLLRTLPTAASAAAWLGAALDTPGAALLRAWAEQMEPRLEAATTLPRHALAGLAYSCGSGAALLRADEAQPLPIKNNWVALTPEAMSADGRYFAAIERIDPLHINLRLIDLSTGAASTMDGAGNISILGWTPDGRLLYRRQEDVTQVDEPALLAQLNPATGAWRPWLPQLVTAWGQDQWTPDHATIYLRIPPRPVSQDPRLLRGVAYQVAVSVAADGTLTNAFENPVGLLAPNGRLIVGSFPAVDQYRELRLWDVVVEPWAWRALARRPALASTGPAPTGAWPVLWSPDSGQIALEAWGEDYGRRVLTINADGTGLREHLHLSDSASAITALAFSADAAYLAAQVTGAGGVEAMTVVTHLATGAQWREPLAGHAGLAWSPTGHLLALVTQDGVKVRDLDTGAVRWVTLTPCDHVAWYDLP